MLRVVSPENWSSGETMQPLLDPKMTPLIRQTLMGCSFYHDPRQPPPRNGHVADYRNVPLAFALNITIAHVPEFDPAWPARHSLTPKTNVLLGQRRLDNRGVG